MDEFRGQISSDPPSSNRGVGSTSAWKTLQWCRRSFEMRSSMSGHGMHCIEVIRGNTVHSTR